jgi:hypothetical protein
LEYRNDVEVTKIDDRTGRGVSRDRLPESRSTTTAATTGGLAYP